MVELVKFSWLHKFNICILYVKDWSKAFNIDVQY